MKIIAPDFDLEKTLNCGQVFHWEKIGNKFYGTIDDLPLALSQIRQTLLIEAPDDLDGLKPSRFPRRQTMVKKDFLADVVSNYFSLDHPLAEICRSFPRDPAMTAARDFCHGLRIIRQPRWECLATFICSSMKQVAHIRQISLALRRRFGTKLMVPRVCPTSVAAATTARHDKATIYVTHVYSFPRAERLGRSNEGELRECALGYRAKNLLATARLVANGEADLEAWSKLPDDELRARLCGLPGVGAKVANCVMLFAYERLRAFPVDVWIERVLRQQYFSGKRKVSARQLREFCDSYFGEHGGYAQQYLFHHARKGGKVVRPGDVRYDLRGEKRRREGRLNERRKETRP
jgi:N-glycosylase/DNA lyase